jgi:hypothetical protein
LGFVGVDSGDFFGGDGLKFLANGVGRESRSKKAAIQTGDFAVGNFAACQPELAFNAMSNREPLRFVVRGGFDGSLNVGVGHAAGAEIARDAKFPLPADFGSLSGELLRIPRIVELPVFFHARHHDLREKLVGRPAIEQPLHLLHGVRPPHQGPQSDIVELLLGIDFFRGREHEESMR